MIFLKKDNNLVIDSISLLLLNAALLEQVKQMTILKCFFSLFLDTVSQRMVDSPEDG